MAKKRPLFGVSNYVKRTRKKRPRRHAKSYSKRIPPRKRRYRGQGQMTTSNKEAKDFHKMIEKLKKEADQEEDYNGGGAYRAFLKLFYKAKIEDDKKK